MVNYWKVKQYIDRDYEISKKHGFVGICWRKLNENLSWIRQYGKNTARLKLKKKLQRLYQDIDSRQRGKWCNEIINFVKMKKKDIVLTHDKAVKEVLVGSVSEKYNFNRECTDGSNCQHRQPVKWERTINNADISTPLLKALNQQGTVINLNEYREEINWLVQFGRKFVLPELKIIEHNKERLNDISERILYLDEFDFEEFVANILELWLNCKTEVTGKRHGDGYRGDGGIDIQCGFLNPKEGAYKKRYTFPINVQVKRIKNPVGAKEIIKLMNKTTTNEVGIFVTTSTFTKDAKDVAKNKESPIYLIDGRFLAQLILNYYNELDEKFKNTLKIEKL